MAIQAARGVFLGRTDRPHKELPSLIAVWLRKFAAPVPGNSIAMVPIDDQESVTNGTHNCILPTFSFSGAMAKPMDVVRRIVAAGGPGLIWGEGVIVGMRWLILIICSLSSGFRMWNSSYTEGPIDTANETWLAMKERGGLLATTLGKTGVFVAASLLFVLLRLQRGLLFRSMWKYPDASTIGYRGVRVTG